MTKYVGPDAATTDDLLTKGKADGLYAAIGTTGALPAGGTTGQILAKLSATDGDAGWEDAPSGGGVDTTAMHDRGAYSSSASYALGDVVSYQNKSYLCTSAVTHAAPSYVGASSQQSHTTAGANIALPAGSQVGDVAVLTIAARLGAIVQPAGFVVGASAAPSANSMYYTVSSYALVAADITAGFITVPTQTAAYWGAVLQVVRNVGTTLLDAAQAQAWALAAPVTPDSYPVVVLQSAGWLEASAGASPTVDGGSGFTYSAVPTLPNPRAAAVYDIVTTGSVAAHTFADAGAGNGQEVFGVALCAPAGFPSGSFREIAAIHDANGRLQAADPAAAGDLATKNYVDTRPASPDTTAMHYKGAWSSGSYAVDDVVTYQGKLYVCTTAVPTSTPVEVGSARTAISSGNALVNVPLPTGSAAGQLAFLSILTWVNPCPAQLPGPAGFTWLGQIAHGGASNYGVCALYSKTLTATDIANGYVTVPGYTGGSSSGAVLRVFESGTVDSVAGTAGSLVTPTITVPRNGILYAGFIDSNTSADATPTPALTDSAHIGPTNAGMALRDGLYSEPSGGTQTITFSNVVNEGTAGYQSVIAASIHPTGTFSLGNFTEVATDNPIIANLDSVSASGGAQTIPDVTTSTMHRIVLTAACTLTFPAAAAGKRFRLALAQDATGGWTVTWPGTVKWPGGTAPTLSAASKTDVFEFECYDGTNWLGRTLALAY